LAAKPRVQADAAENDAAAIGRAVVDAAAEAVVAAEVLATAAALVDPSRARRTLAAGCAARAAARRSSIAQVLCVWRVPAFCL
jgi:hypothetical protein